jgi:hypothetical protein
MVQVHLSDTEIKKKAIEKAMQRDFFGLTALEELYSLCKLTIHFSTVRKGKLRGKL